MTDHDDELVSEIQRWLETHFPVADPVEEMSRRWKLTNRTLERRFRKATGFSPLAYVQFVRVEAAKRRLAASKKPVDEISIEVGYENPAYFRRLFKRDLGMTPSAYRRKFLLSHR